MGHGGLSTRVLPELPTVPDRQHDYFGVLSVALSLRAQEKGKQIIDGVLLFAPPLIGFGMQYAITRHMAYGPALSALGYGGFYLVLAKFALRRSFSLGRPLVLSATALGGAFTTLAIPLALSARWTAMARSLEGLGILWLGVQQQQRRMSYSGTALLVLAVGSALWALANGTTALSVMLILPCSASVGWLLHGYGATFGCRAVGRYSLVVWFSGLLRSLRHRNSF